MFRAVDIFSVFLKVFTTEGGLLYYRTHWAKVRTYVYITLDYIYTVYYTCTKSSHTRTYLYIYT